MANLDEKDKKQGEHVTNQQRLPLLLICKSINEK